MEEVEFGSVLIAGLHCELGCVGDEATMWMLPGICTGALEEWRCGG